MSCHNIYSECGSVALVIQHPTRIRHIVICGLSACTKFFHITDKRHYFLYKKKLLNIKTQNVFLFYFLLNIYLIFLILRRTEGHMITNVYLLSIKK